MKRCGLTLLELLVALVVCALILIVGQTLVVRLLANEQLDRDRAELAAQMDFALTQMQEAIRQGDGVATGNKESLDDNGPLPGYRLIVRTTYSTPYSWEGSGLKNHQIYSIQAAFTFDLHLDDHRDWVIGRAISRTRFSETATKQPLTANLGRGAKMRVTYYDDRMQPTRSRDEVRFVKVELCAGHGAGEVRRHRMMAVPERRMSDGDA